MQTIELENVRPTLLLPPTEKGGIASELAGGVFDLGDRVACLKATGGLDGLWHMHCMQPHHHVLLGLRRTCKSGAFCSSSVAAAQVQQLKWYCCTNVQQVLRGEY